MSGKWAGSRRREELPPDWPQIREQVKVRDGYRCKATLRDDSRCPEPGTDVDHIGDRNDHTLPNLQLLCSWHHDRKSAAQGNAARPKPPPLRRPAEKHPGMR
jgi:hypothetical protein